MSIQKEVWKSTGPFLKTGCNVTAVELGKNLALYTKRKYKDYSNLKVIQSSFEDYECSDNKNEQSSRYPIIQKQMPEYGFADFQSHMYHNTRTMTGEEYIELLDTYSDHRALDKTIRVPLYNSIKAAIEESGNELIINDTVDLYLAWKTGLEL